MRLLGLTHTRVKTGSKFFATGGKKLLFAKYLYEEAPGWIQTQDLPNVRLTLVTVPWLALFGDNPFLNNLDPTLTDSSQPQIEGL